MIAYFDCFSGISGDMVLAALINAGVPAHKLKKALSCLPVKGYRLNVKHVKRAGFSATKVDVKTTKDTALRRFKDIEKVIKKSSLSKGIKQQGLSIFKKLFEAEAEVHGERYDRIHLHELGAIDCIVDIIGTLIGLNMLGVNKIYSSPVNLGSGTVKTGHGILPVPAPATALLLKNIPVYSSDTNLELTTPTGAAIISSLAGNFGLMPCMKVSEVGIGAGNTDLKNRPNVLRLFIGQGLEQGFQKQVSAESGVTVIETNIDDMNPQVYEYVLEKLFKAGALDVFLTQVIMKKGRPGIKLTVLCRHAKKDVLIKVLLRETTSIGVRFHEEQRETLTREVKLVDTKAGKVRVKISKNEKDIVKKIPEYEDCKKIAKKFNIPLLDVIRTVTVKS